MDGRTRCAKWFIIMTGPCKMMILTFVQQRLKGQTLENYILHNNLTVDKIIKQAYDKMVASNSSHDADISALCSIIKRGNILNSLEKKNSGSPMFPTIGDQIDRIRCMRNDLMHISEASLDESDYNDYLNEIKELAKFFENINGCAGIYRKEIEEIDGKILDSNELEKTMTEYKVYLDWVIAWELPKPLVEIPKPPIPVPNREGPYVRQVAEYYADMFENPIGQAAGLLVGGAGGLLLDVGSFLTRPFR